jgi:predicted PhzF superfamily epimerase YddE/YHI9
MRVGGIEVSIVDVFVGPDALGNPAGVVFDEEGLDEVDMARVAGEIGLSETAFVRSTPTGTSLRWFTPTCEVELCGHATLAAAAVLAERGLLESGSITFVTHAGPLLARAGDGRASVHLPRRESSESALPVWAAGQGIGALRAPGVLLVELDDAGAVRRFAPPLAELSEEPVDLVVLWALGGVGAEVSLRVFGPRIGLDEDPVTGSAQCALAPVVAARIGRNRFRAHQCSARGGRLEVALRAHAVEVAGTTLVREEGGAGA